MSGAAGMSGAGGAGTGGAPGAGAGGAGAGGAAGGGAGAVAERRRGSALWRLASVLYAVGFVLFLGTFALIFVAFFAGWQNLDDLELWLLMAAWPILFAAAVLDVLRRH